MIAVHHNAGLGLCPYCKAAFRMRESCVQCVTCGTLHHSICWLQNENHCSIFRCSGTDTLARQTESAAFLRAILMLHCICNVVLHFFIHPVGRLIEQIHPADALMILMMECGIVASGLSVLTKLLYIERRRESNDSLSLLGSVLIGTNIVFLSFLLYLLIAEGMQSLYALISF
ncbi:MAG TPA: hypothetical protein VI958_09125 [Acidobacteriota bacterium]